MTIKQTKEWFGIAIPDPTERQFSIQVGVHCEELVEMLMTLVAKDISTSVTLKAAIATMHTFAEQLKNRSGSVMVVDPVEFLDALADQIVTATGCAHIQKMDIVGALDEVNRSNFSKFEDGEAVFNENGKITKGKNYSPPDLTPFV